jgi:hypothetical protein
MEEVRLAVHTGAVEAVLLPCESHHLLLPIELWLLAEAVVPETLFVLLRVAMVGIHQASMLQAVVLTQIPAVKEVLTQCRE